jgi:hypothetical protein
MTSSSRPAVGLAARRVLARRVLCAMHCCSAHFPQLHPPGVCSHPPAACADHGRYTLQYCHKLFPGSGGHLAVIDAVAGGLVCPLLPTAHSAPGNFRLVGAGTQNPHVCACWMLTDAHCQRRLCRWEEVPQTVFHAAALGWQGALVLSGDCPPAEVPNLLPAPPSMLYYHPYLICPSCKLQM